MLVQTIKDGKIKEAIRLIQDGEDVHSMDQGVTPLIEAIKTENSILIDTILNKGVDVNSKCLLHHRSPLSYCAELGPIVYIPVLFSVGASLESEDKHGRTPIMKAAQRSKDSRKAVQEFIKLGAEVNKVDYDEVCPLMYAIDGYNKEAAIELLRAGADPNKEDNYHMTPLVSALTLFDSSAIIIVRSLLKHGADPNKLTDSGKEHPLMAAIDTKNPEFVRVMLQYGAEPSMKTAKNTTPLRYLEHLVTKHPDSEPYNEMYNMIMARYEEEPKNNKGREYCFWCSRKNVQKPIFNFFDFFCEKCQK